MVAARSWWGEREVGTFSRRDRVLVMQDEEGLEIHSTTK